MKVKWNNCFFCLNELQKESSDDLLVPFKVKRLKSLLNYLIGGDSEQKLNVVEKVSNLWTPSDPTSRVDFCDNCNDQVNLFIKLQVELEVIQLKIVEILKELRKVIIQNSKYCGEDTDNLGKLGLHIFEDWLKSQSTENQNDYFEEEVKNGRIILDTLYVFQEAVFDNANSTSKNIPYVYLENFCGKLSQIPVRSPRCRPGPKSKKSSQIITPIPSNNSTSQLDDQTVVKIEPECPPTPFIPDDTFDDSDNLDNPLDNFDSIKFEDNLPSKLVKSPRKKTVIPKRISSRKSKKSTKVSKPKTPKKSIKKLGRPKKTNSIPKKSLKVHQTPRKKKRRSCDNCQFSTKSIHKFEFHLRKHELPESKPFSCAPCNLSFSTKQYQDFHLACHQGQYKLRCDLCSKNVDLILLTQHMKGHHKNGDPPLKLFPCPNCSYCTSLRDKYLEHLREHDKSGQFFCDICGSEVADRGKLLSHLYSEHDAIQKLSCGFDGCKMEYFDNIRLWNHEQTHKRQWICEFCGKACTSPGSLKVHERNHTGERPFPCDKCSENFKTKLDLNRHLINKHNAEKYHCGFCDKEYRDPSSLQNHMRVHDGSAFPCEKCGQAFVSKYQLRRHMNAHSTERNFVCEECGKAFRTKDTLASHIKTHTGALRFKCSYCSKAFKINQHLIAHLRTHTGERPFVCDICGSSFTQAGPLNNHKKKHLSEPLNNPLAEFEISPPKRETKS